MDTARGALRIAELRMQLATAQIEERRITDAYKIAKASAEIRAIEAAGGEKAIGSNAEARDRALTLALAADSEYQNWLGLLRTTEVAVIRLSAELEGEKDLRRQAEWETRERLFQALDYLTSEDRASLAEMKAEEADEFSIVAEALADDAIDNLIEEQSEIGR